MKALIFDHKGDLSALTLADAPIPRPNGGEVLVEVMAAGLNPSDVKNVLGFFPYTTLPRIPGRDFAGMVREGPPELVGQKVWGTGLGLGFTRDGAHAQFLTLPAAGCAMLPERLSFAEAAACGVPYTTAWDGLRRVALGPSRSLVVVGANGAVGRAALALGRALRARVVGAVRRPEQVETLAVEGYEAFVLDAPDDLEKTIAEKLGGGADVIFDTTGAWLPACVRAAAPHGAICVIAPPGMGRLTVEFPVLDFYRRGLTLVGVNSLLHDTIACARMLSEFAGLFDSGALPPSPAPEERPLAAGPAAYAEVDAGYGRKIVLTNG
jgi:NADPH:quinone reductase